MLKKFFISFLVLGVFGLGSICFKSLGGHGMMNVAQAASTNSICVMADCNSNNSVSESMNCCFNSRSDQKISDFSLNRAKTSSGPVPVIGHLGYQSIIPLLQLQNQTTQSLNFPYRSPPGLTGIVVKKE